MSRAKIRPRVMVKGICVCILVAGLSSNNAAATPTVTNVGVSNVTLTSVWLVGELTSTGTAPTDVWVFWGDSRQGTNKAAWANTNSFGTRNVGTLSMQATGLADRVTYYYRFLASNANGEVWATKGLILVRSGHSEEGIALMERAIERDPRAQMAHQTLNNLGLAYLQGGDCLKAIESLERSLEVRGDYQNAMYNLGLANEACGNGGEAIRAYERFLAASTTLNAEQERSVRARLERLRRDQD